MCRVDDQDVGTALQVDQADVHLFGVLAEVGPDVEHDLLAGQGLLDLPGDDLTDGEGRVVRIAQRARAADHDQRKLVPGPGLVGELRREDGQPVLPGQPGGGGQFHHQNRKGRRPAGQAQPRQSRSTPALPAIPQEDPMPRPRARAE